jgi:hypothetical protein
VRCFPEKVACFCRCVVTTSLRGLLLVIVSFFRPSSISRSSTQNIIIYRRHGVSGGQLGCGHGL